MDSTGNYSRLFTVNEANELLPKLRPLVEQILENIRRLKSASETVIRREQLDADAPDLMEHLRRRCRDRQAHRPGTELGRGNQRPRLRVQGRGAGTDRLSVHARRRGGVSLLAARRTERRLLAWNRGWFRRAQAAARRWRCRPGRRNFVPLIGSRRSRLFPRFRRTPSRFSS